MLQKAKKRVRAKTKRHELFIDCFYDFIDKSNVVVKKELFAKMCKDGCKNFNKKYSCPPFSPKFNKYVKKYHKLLVLLFAINLKQFDKFNYKPYHKIRIANAVMKSRAEHVMRDLESKFDSFYLSTGACRLCKPCQLKFNRPCRYPQKRRYSLEALGVDCNLLSQKLFNFHLLWYEPTSNIDYTCVICALPLKRSVNEEKVTKELETHLDKLCRIR